MITTPAGNVARVATGLTWRDHLGGAKVRWGIGRMHYTVAPGLYAVGAPRAHDPVLVTANYKLSFDHLRKVLSGRNAWILVLDTKGVNVWCAAGKGTFGTDELVLRMRAAHLDTIVTHRTVIVPQLGAPGISAHKVKKATGYKVIFGPVMARDLPAFLDSGMKASPEMRRKSFPLAERVALIPVELVTGMKWAISLVPIFYLLGGLAGRADFIAAACRHGAPVLWSTLGGVVGGAIVTPLCLPYLPGRAFSLKGLFAGIATMTLFFIAYSSTRGTPLSFFETGSMWFTALAVSSFYGMNFTGTSTYTSLSGVKKEMRIAVPMQLIGLGIALIFWVLWIFKI